MHMWLTNKEKLQRNAAFGDLTKNRTYNYTSAISTSVIPKICLSHFQGSVKQQGICEVKTNTLWFGCEINIFLVFGLVRLFCRSLPTYGADQRKGSKLPPSYSVHLQTNKMSCGRKKRKERASKASRKSPLCTERLTVRISHSTTKY